MVPVVGGLDPTAGLSPRVISFAFASSINFQFYSGAPSPDATIYIYTTYLKYIVYKYSYIVHSKVITRSARLLQGQHGHSKNSRICRIVEFVRPPPLHSLHERM